VLSQVLHESGIKMKAMGNERRNKEKKSETFREGRDGWNLIPEARDISFAPSIAVQPLSRW